jgi:hypothetical protein
MCLAVSPDTIGMRISSPYPNLSRPSFTKNDLLRRLTAADGGEGERAILSDASGKSKPLLESADLLCNVDHVSGWSMQYCVILDVENITGATAVGMLLQQFGYIIVSTQVTPSDCPIQQEASNCGSCPVVAKPAAPTVEQLGVRTMVSNRKE